MPSEYIITYPTSDILKIFDISKDEYNNRIPIYLNDRELTPFILCSEHPESDIYSYIISKDIVEEDIPNSNLKIKKFNGYKYFYCNLCKKTWNIVLGKFSTLPY